MNIDETRRTTEEAYSVATTSSDLTVTPDANCDVDYLIAAGWCQQLIGGALMRLHTEWERTGRQRRATAEQFLGAVNPALNKSEAAKEAATLARTHNIRELDFLRAQLKSWPVVEQALILRVSKWGIEPERARALVIDVMCWWLDKVCQACGGTQYETVPGTNRQSSRLCKSCRGTGERPVPQGQEGRKLAIFIEDCVGRGRDLIRKRLRTMPHHG